MLSKSHIKLIRQLNQKKYRYQNKLFTVEGVKSVTDFLNAGFKVKWLFALPDFDGFSDTILISEKELKTISNLKTPNRVLAVFQMPDPQPISGTGLSVALDTVNDPGNLGTIIRLCDWFGVDQLVCSEDTVDCYNPKTVQASMGSLARLPVVYTDLPSFLQLEKRPVYGTFMNGENIYRSELPREAVIVMGNEANGISDPVSNVITKKISIPQFGTRHETESLNVAMATAVILSEFKRNSI